MKPLRSILAGLALALLTTPAWAVQVPVSADTSGSAVTNKITKTAGGLPNLTVSSKSTAFLSFDVSRFGLASSQVNDARLILYYSRVAKPGNIAFHVNTAAFQEKFTAASVASPAFGPAGSLIPVTAAQTKSYVELGGLKDLVRSWLDDPSSNFGLAITGDAAVNVMLASKETSIGVAAVLEIDVNPTGDLGATTVTATGALTVAGQSTFNDDVTIANDKHLFIQGTGGITLGGGIDATGNVTANLFASSIMATDSLTAHVSANLQGTSTFGGVATFNGTAKFASDVTLNSSQTLGGGGSISLGGHIEAQDGRFGSTLSVGTANFAQRGTLDVRGRRGTIPGQPAGTILSFIVLNSAFIGSSSNFDLSSGSGIFTDSDIIGGTINALSDERIKDIQGRSDSAADLAKMRQLEITDYFYKDRFYRGNRPQKKLIAQQVEKIFPQAVSRHTDVVPDIYQTAEIADGWLNLATNLQVGDRVRLIGTKESEDGVYEVTEVGPGGFRTTFQPQGSKVFVYGREVKDFRTVDYEAIAMLNVSATQELAKKIEAKDAALTALRADNTALAERLAALEARAAARTVREDELAARLARLEAPHATRRPARLTTASLSLK